MSTDLLVVLNVILIVSVTVLVFYFQNREIKMQHKQSVSFLKNHILEHKSAIDFRYRHLDRYDFLQYNLSEALVVQKNINCNFN